LIIHITAAFVLCSVLSVEALSLIHLRRASTIEEAQPWIEPVPRLRLFAVGSVLSIQFSGIYLIYRTSSFGQMWAVVAMATFPLLMAPFGNMTARHMRAVRQAFQSKGGSETELLRMLRARLLKLSLGIRIAAFLGTFVLVSAKPGLWGAVGIVASSLAILLAISSTPWRRIGSPAVPKG